MTLSCGWARVSSADGHSPARRTSRYHLRPCQTLSSLIFKRVPEARPLPTPSQAAKAAPRVFQNQFELNSSDGKLCAVRPAASRVNMALQSVLTGAEPERQYDGKFRYNRIDLQCCMPDKRVKIDECIGRWLQKQRWPIVDEPVWHYCIRPKYD